MASPDFEKQIIDLLPKMRGWAWFLTRDANAVDDLVQDAAVKTLLACESFVPGTNFPAWVRRIMTNHFISSLRQRRELTTLEDVPESFIVAAQQDRITVRELGRAFQTLPKAQKDALHWIAIQERSYEEVSTSTGLAIGTVKSRVHRGRLNLRAYMDHEVPITA